MVKVRQDLTGSKFGMLTVIKQAEDKVSPSGKRRATWLCRCDCGNYKEIDQDSLKGGMTKSCGCQQFKGMIESNFQRKEKNDKKIVGKKFNHLTVLQRDNTFKTIHYLCKCDCGNIVSVSKTKLISGEKTNCGCLENKGRYEDLTGQKFGKLTPLYYTQTKNKKAYWMCQCECGNQKEISAEAMKRGNTMSCGCMKQSHGEYIIENLLKENNIFYEKEFRAFKYEDSGVYARFDFCIDNKYFIEFDGRQHIESNNRWWNSPELVEKQKRHDTIKNEWCKKNNIPLIRIPYDHIKYIKLEDLQLDTTSFLVK